MRSSSGELTPHEDVVASIAEHTLGCGATIGVGGGRFSPGAFGDGCLALSARGSSEKYSRISALLCDCLLRGEPSLARVRVQAAKLLNAVPRSARDGGACAAALLLSRTRAAAGSNARAAAFPCQQVVLTRVLAACESEPQRVLDDLTALRSSLLSSPSRILLHVAASLTSLSPPPAASPLDVWRASLLPALSVRSAQPASAPLLALLPGRVAWSSSPSAAAASPYGWAAAVGNPAVDSGFLSSRAPGPGRFDHPDSAPLIVACEALTMLEGPLWKGLRGTGLAYSYSLHPSFEDASVVFGLYKSTAVAAAWAEAARIVRRAAAAGDGCGGGGSGGGGAPALDATSLETAVSSAIFAVVNGERTPSAAGRASLLACLRGTGPGASRRLVAALRSVTLADAARVLRAYVVPLFDSQTCAAAMCVNADKAGDAAAALAAAGLGGMRVTSLEEAFGTAASVVCVAKKGDDAADGAGCACFRCLKPGGPFSLR